MGTERTGGRGAAIAFIVVVVLLGALVAAMDARKAYQVLERARWSLLPVALLCTALSYLALSLGYALVNRVFGIGMRVRDLTAIGFVSFALNNLVSVGGLAGYSLRLVLMRRRGIATGDVIGASLVHSYMNHIIMMSLLPLGLFYILLHHPIGRAETLRVAAAAGISVLILVASTVLLFSAGARERTARALAHAARRLVHRDVELQLRGLDDKLGLGVEALRAHPAALGLPLLCVLVDWATSVIALGVCFAALGGRLHPGVLLTGFAIGVSVGFLSMLPGGMGAQEGSMTGVYVLLGVQLEHAVLAAILFRLVYYIVPFAISLGWYGRLLRVAADGGAANGGDAP